MCVCECVPRHAFHVKSDGGVYRKCSLLAGQLMMSVTTDTMSLDVLVSIFLGKCIYAL